MREIERARVTAFLPNDTEGYFLPALEGLEEFEIHNQGESVEMRSETRAKLAAYYAPLNRELYELLGYKFDWDHV